MSAARTAPAALLFDVFGTVVDWRTCVARELAAALGEGGEQDWAALADAWRARYQPAMEDVRSGRRAWTVLDTLHRENLEAVLEAFGVTVPPGVSLEELNRAWHRLDPWPDVLPGLTRLKRAFVVGPHSNGNIALLTNMAKRAGLPWDVILGAEVVRAYKPLPRSYTRAAAALGLEPGQCMMVAAHNDDLSAARRQGLATAFVPRPLEHGPGQTSDLTPAQAWDCVASDFEALAERLGC